MKGFFSDIWSIKKNILVLLLGLLAGTFALVFVLMWFLGFYTQHGESVEVPDLKNLKIEDARKLLATRDLNIEIMDSICKGNGIGGLIKDQMPKANARVKESRKIYITVTRHTDCTATIHYNQIIGRPLDFVRKQLRRNKLKIGTLKYIPGGKAANTVVEAYIGTIPLYVEADPSKGQQPPTEPKKIPHGAKVNLVLLEGIDASPKYIPKLSCSRYSEAEFAIMGSKFVMGTIHATGQISDTLSAWIWKQSPAPSSRATMGTGVDIWIMSEKPQGCIDEELEAIQKAAQKDSIKKAAEANPLQGING